MVIDYQFIKCIKKMIFTLPDHFVPLVSHNSSIVVDIQNDQQEEEFTKSPSCVVDGWVVMPNVIPFAISSDYFLRASFRIARDVLLWIDKGSTGHPKQEVSIPMIIVIK